mgnify:FL=1
MIIIQPLTLERNDIILKIIRYERQLQQSANIPPTLASHSGAILGKFTGGGVNSRGGATPMQEKMDQT